MSQLFFSTTTLLAELFIAALIFFVLYQGCVKNIFNKSLAFFVIGYETVFNVGYMIFRSVGGGKTLNLSSAIKIFVAVHGIVSFALLIFVWVLFLRASKKYASGVNYFREKWLTTAIFVALWIFSLLSGFMLYLKVYFV